VTNVGIIRSADKERPRKSIYLSHCALERAIRNNDARLGQRDRLGEYRGHGQQNNNTVTSECWKSPL
jgi:hypothetical protein